MNQIQLREEILSHIHMPLIACKEVSAAEFGLVPNAPEMQTEKLQAALDTLSARGGGRLLLPAGVYRIGALTLPSGVELHLADAGTVVQFVPITTQEHYPLVFCHWEASPCYNFSPLLYAFGAHDIAVTGQGILDGGADASHWWNWHHQVETSWSENKPDLQLKDRGSLRRMNHAGTPVKERIFGDGHYLRPNFFQPVQCNRVLLSGVTLRNSPMWQVNPVQCESVIIDGITLSSHGSNNDGCDPESCSGVWIKNCKFDTGDDCISIKSGRDRDGREANIPSRYVLIEQNNFADGHGGIALGSEMSGGISHVLACHNHFASPNLTYALRLKTNAKRGGKVQHIMLTDSVMEHVHGAAVHGTMLYEDGRNGDDLPLFSDITIENIEAHGGDYGVFLEAFAEVPITNLVLRNITIDGAAKPLRSMHWQNPVMENVVINGKAFPRPGYVRIKGIPCPGYSVSAYAESCGNEQFFTFTWKGRLIDGTWAILGSRDTLTVPQGIEALQLVAADAQKNQESSLIYRVLPDAAEKDSEAFAMQRLQCRGMLPVVQAVQPHMPVTRLQVAQMLTPLADLQKCGKIPADTADAAALVAVANAFFVLDSAGNFNTAANVTRQEMATVAMQACQVNYRNASSTMPVCADVAQVANNYGTNVARALYFGFMALEDGYFYPNRLISLREAVDIINKVADFAGL
ncbi:MAG: glycoside hydrolase family 28 protein [Oscillospiraceae bacterium]|nr:glycoside hydrolase family 28 protein [Oscillospiraceae bacterium]